MHDLPAAERLLDKAAALAGPGSADVFMHRAQFRVIERDLTKASKPSSSLRIDEDESRRRVQFNKGLSRSRAIVRGGGSHQEEAFEREVDVGSVQVEGSIVSGRNRRAKLPLPQPVAASRPTHDSKPPLPPYNLSSLSSHCDDGLSLASLARTRSRARRRRRTSARASRCARATYSRTCGSRPCSCTTPRAATRARPATSSPRRDGAAISSRLVSSRLGSACLVSSRLVLRRAAPGSPSDPSTDHSRVLAARSRTEPRSRCTRWGGGVGRSTSLAPSHTDSATHRRRRGGDAPPSGHPRDVRYDDCVPSRARRRARVILRMARALSLTLSLARSLARSLSPLSGRGARANHVRGPPGQGRARAR